MFTYLSKWLLFATSYIPLYIIISIYSLPDKWENLKFENIKSGLFWVPIILLAVSLALLVILYLLIETRKIKSKQIKVKNIRSINSEIINYLLAYIIPFALTNSMNYKTIIIYIILFFLIGGMYVKNDLLYLNPMLYLLGYNIYVVIDFNENQYILISKSSAFNLNKKEFLQLSSISPPIYKDITN